MGQIPLTYPPGMFVDRALITVKAGDGGKDDPAARALSQKYASLIAEEEFAAWMASLKASNPVEINKAALETKER